MFRRGHQANALGVPRPVDRARRWRGRRSCGRPLGAADDVDINHPAGMDDLVHDRTVQQLVQARAQGLADHDLGDVMAARIGDHRLGHRADLDGR